MQTGTRGNSCSCEEQGRGTAHTSGSLVKIQMHFFALWRLCAQQKTFIIYIFDNFCLTFEQNRAPVNTFAAEMYSNLTDIVLALLLA